MRTLSRQECSMVGGQKLDMENPLVAYAAITFGLPLSIIVGGAIGALPAYGLSLYVTSDAIMGTCVVMGLFGAVAGAGIMLDEMGVQVQKNA